MLLLDCGPETPHAAQRAGVDLTGLRHVLITHAHPDHCSPAFLLFRSWVGDDPARRARPGRRHRGGPDVGGARTPGATSSSVAPGDRLQVGGYDVRVLAAAHGDATVLYDVTAPSGGRVLYATDTGPLPDATVEAVRDAAFDVVLLEETFGDHVTHGTEHLDLGTFPEQVRRLRAVGAVHDATDLVAVHLSHHNPPTAELARRLAAWGARVVDDGTVLGGPAARRTLVDGRSRPRGVSTVAAPDAGDRGRPVGEVPGGGAAARRRGGRDLRGDGLPRRARRRVVRAGPAAPRVPPGALDHARDARPGAAARGATASRCSSTA